MKPRNYQHDCIISIAEALGVGPSTLVVMPTGTGKTIVFGYVAAAWKRGRVLIIAHRDELIQQAAMKVGAIVGEQCAIEKGQDRSNEDSLYAKAHVVVTSVQTMCRPNRHARFDPMEFGLVIVDEAHHSVAETYLRVLAHFRQNKDLKVLGVTATPDRADEEALGRVYHSVAYEYGIKDAIHDGWLVPIQQQFIKVHGLDFSACRTTAGDLNQGDLAAVMEAEKTLHGVVDPTLKIANGRKTLVFTASVAHAERCCEIANRHESGCAEWVSGATPLEDRRELFARYRRGDFPYLFNCAIATEGFDEPGIEVVANARPTKSRALYAQCIGRGTRPLAGVVDNLESADERKAAILASEKPGLLVLDYVGNAGRHKLVHTHDILGVEYDDAELEDALAEIMEKSEAGEPLDVEQAFILAAQRRENARKQKELEDAKRQRFAVERGIRDVDADRRRKVKADAKYSARTIDPFDVFDIHKAREPGWHKGRRPTPKMLNLLRKAKVPEAQLEHMSFWDAKQLIVEVTKRWDKGLCSLRQAAVLKQHGYPQDTTWEDAKKLIDKLAANKWQRV